ncbi:DUF262 domain-containing protein [Bdellovibrio sp. HCB274]|uniref:DUF262 domain-containing protein n=1 Tax=Bdellovibrio sp. HCB274 TaxID=3394361 RepID=UPI0039B566D4
MAKKGVSKTSKKASSKKQKPISKDQVLAQLKSLKSDTQLYNEILSFFPTQTDTGLEAEIEVDNEEGPYGPEPIYSELGYDPSTIRVAFRQYPVDLLIKRIQENAINFTPGFQRAAAIWNKRAQSRLIESVLIKIPLPVFYMDNSNEDQWDVIDGVQRLTAFKSFAVDKVLKLQELEFMPELEGRGFDDLPRNLQRRFLESYISLYLIEKGTPKRVKQSIYERINTGGTTLVAQEIRQAIFQGSITQLLDKMVSYESFKRATDNGISSLRMADKECATRFIAFYLEDYQTYRTKDMDRFLSDSLEKLSTKSRWEQDRVAEKFDFSMHLAFELFGKTAFRKPIPKAQINKALFETISSTLAKLSHSEARALVEKKKTLKSRFLKLSNDEEFNSSISTGTGDVRKVQHRFFAIENLIRGIIND